LRTTGRKARLGKLRREERAQHPPARALRDEARGNDAQPVPRPSRSHPRHADLRHHTMTTPIAAFIFDIDGTIIDSMPYHNRSWPLMLARHGFGETAGEIVRSSPGRTGIELMREVFGADLTLERAHALVEEKESIYRALFGP